jgi:CheY-like chemotaxis protein
MNTRSDSPADPVNDVSLEVLRRLEGMTELAARLTAGASAGEVEANARALATGAEDVRRLIEHARDLQRAERGELPFEPAPCPLRELMAAIEEEWKDRIAGAGLELSVSYEGDAAQAAVIDGGRLRQLFDALLARAVTETRSGIISIGLRVTPGPDALTIEGSVRDSGRSLTADQLAHIFDPAEAARPQADASLPTRVGMALANRLVQAMSGVLQAQANDEGGVTVTFDLMAPAVGQTKARRRPHILIVDDNDTNRMVAEALCEMFDCTSESARDGVEAVEAVKTRAYDLILMDIKMPRMSGVEATLEIRAMPGAVARTPIVALTANTDRADVRSYFEAGMNDVVEKPIKPTRLSEVLELVPAWVESRKTAAA